MLLGWGKALRGWARAESEEGEAGIADIQQGMLEVAGRGLGLERPGCIFSDWLSDSLRKVGRHDDALGALDLGVAQAEQWGQHYYDAELYRLRAEILLETADSREPVLSPVEGSSVEREKTAEEASQGHRDRPRPGGQVIRLRAATSLARLWQRQGKRAEAYELLERVYGWFTEGFDTADLQAAQVLLAELEPMGDER